MSGPPTPAATHNLDAVLAEAWRVFGRYHFGRPLEICRCNVCVQPEEEALLLRTPVPKMSARLLQAYTESAHESSSYADEQFRALLPRYFELIAGADWPSHSPEVTLRRLADASWGSAWPASEVALIERFFLALFAAWLGTKTGPLAESDSPEILGMVAIAGGDIKPLLAAWDEDSSLTASLKLADLILTTSWGPGMHRLGAFWEDMPVVEAQVIGWIRAPKNKVRLADAFFATGDPEEQQRLSAAEQVL